MNLHIVRRSQFFLTRAVAPECFACGSNRVKIIVTSDHALCMFAFPRGILATKVLQGVIANARASADP